MKSHLKEASKGSVFVRQELDSELFNIHIILEYFWKEKKQCYIRKYYFWLLYWVKYQLLFFIGYFMYLHFKCYPLSRIPLQICPILFPHPILLWVCYPTHLPTPTSLTCHFPTLGNQAFMETRAFSHIDARQWHHLLHMQLEQCVPPHVSFAGWFCPWELWGVCLIFIVVLPKGLQTPSAPSVLSLTPPLENPCLIQ